MILNLSPGRNVGRIINEADNILVDIKTASQYSTWVRRCSLRYLHHMFGLNSKNAIFCTLLLDALLFFLFGLHVEGIGLFSCVYP